MRKHFLVHMLQMSRDNNQLRTHGIVDIYGHLGSRNLEKLARDNLVDGFDYDSSRGISFCQACVDRKLHRSQFLTTRGKRAKEPLGLIHSDVCGKIQTRPLGRGYYFLTFIEDSTRYVWVYILKNKSQVFEKFVEWKL